MQLGAIIALIQGIIAAEPDIELAVKAIKNFITDLVSQNLIPASRQNDVFAYVDAAAQAALNGEPPPEFTVEPDPQP